MKSTSTVDFEINLRNTEAKKKKKKMEGGGREELDQRYSICSSKTLNTYKMGYYQLCLFLCLDYILKNKNQQEKGKLLMNKSCFTGVYNFTWPNLKQVTETFPPHVLQ